MIFVLKGLILMLKRRILSIERDELQFHRGLVVSVYGTWSVESFVCLSLPTQRLRPCVSWMRRVGGWCVVCRRRRRLLLIVFGACAGMWMVICLLCGSCLCSMLIHEDREVFLRRSQSRRDPVGLRIHISFRVWLLEIGMGVMCTFG